MTQPLKQYLPPVAGPHQATSAELLACAKWHDRAAARGTPRRDVHLVLAQKLRQSASLAA